MVKLNAAKAPARLLLSQEELSLYQEWQSKTWKGRRGRKECSFSNAYEYRKFYIFYANSIRNEDEASEEKHEPSSSTCQECFHYIPSRYHFRSTQIDVYCPVCNIEVHLDFLFAIGKALIAHGGPYQDLDFPSVEYQRLHQAWHSARAKLANLVNRYEKLGEEEAELDGQNSAKEAIDLATNQSTYPASIMTREEYDKLCRREKSQKKCVSFAQDTNFAGSRHHSSYMRDSSPLYEPGVNSAPDDAEWEDTSFQTNRLFNISQLKVITTTSEEQLEFWNANPDLALTVSEGLAALHPMWHNIRSLVEAFLEILLEEGSQDHFLEKYRTSDAIVLLLTDGEFTNFTILQTSDVVKTWKPSMVVKGWTTLEQCQR